MTVCPVRLKEYVHDDLTGDEEMALWPGCSLTFLICDVKFFGGCVPHVWGLAASSADLI